MSKQTFTFTQTVGIKQVMDKLNLLKLLREACLLLLLYCLISNTFCDGNRKRKTGTGYNARFNSYNRPNAKVNGIWTSWDAWGACSAACGCGYMLRSRTCTNPAPSKRGDYCTGVATEASLCSLPDCPVNGGFTSWVQWSTCAGICGTGSQVRYRTCTNPAPSGDGLGCVGALAEASTCQLIYACPVNGMWAEWTEWSECSTTNCGLGMRQRTRTCTCPSPSAGGAVCTGEPNDIQPCSTRGFCGPLPLGLLSCTSSGLNFEPNPINTAVGSTVAITCEQGSPNKDIVTCQANGQWNERLISCVNTGP